MKKVIIKSKKNKSTMMSNLSRLSDEDTYEMFKLYDKYYMKDLSYTHGLNILRFDVVNDELLIDKLPVSTYTTPDESDQTMLARLILLCNFMSVIEEDKKHVIGNKRNKNTGNNVRQTVNKDEITLDNKIYTKTVNRNKGYEWRTDGFEVRGHFRCLKDGRKVFVKGYKKVVVK